MPAISDSAKRPFPPRDTCRVPHSPRAPSQPHGHAHRYRLSHSPSQAHATAVSPTHTDRLTQSHTQRHCLTCRVSHTITRSPTGHLTDTQRWRPPGVRVSDSSPRSQLDGKLPSCPRRRQRRRQAETHQPKGLDAAENWGSAPETPPGPSPKHQACSTITGVQHQVLKVREPHGVDLKLQPG